MPSVLDVAWTGEDAQYSVHGVRAVLRDTIVDDATIVCEHGLITSITAGGPRAAWSMDGRGAYCLPGLVDSHSDGLEKERSPRPNVVFPDAFALRSYEGRVRAAGVTTMFHGVRFESDQSDEAPAMSQAERVTVALEERRGSPEALVDHQILYRLDARDPAGCQLLLERFAAQGRSSVPLPLVSFEDHTPGQGQYRDVSHYRSWMEKSANFAGRDVDTELQEWMLRRDALIENRSRNLALLRPAAFGGRIRLMTHDPVDESEIEEGRLWGATIAEFPTTTEAARAARTAGMATVMGAPNVMRGGSHSGNVSAEKLVHLGLVTALASDYQPTTLLAAAFILAQREVCSLPEAIALVSARPAAMLGLDDRGELGPTQRADLVLVTYDGNWPTVQRSWRSTRTTQLQTLPDEPLPQEPSNEQLFVRR